MAYKQKSSGLPFKELGSSPAKQRSNREYDIPGEKGTPKDESFETSLSKVEKESEAKSERRKKKRLHDAKRGKSKVDYMQHVTGVNKNSTGEKIEKRRTDYLKSLDKK